ncbi:MAG TPA: SRPBCC family protein [Plantibacter sp.]|uniref:SRPBCC family protein n=1 Tax=Plantibacter sp. TaxID=1871045 RepID=UPI002B8C391D|nr:SRPBCC family protein [Plantibacter sp.]
MRRLNAADDDEAATRNDSTDVSTALAQQSTVVDLPIAAVYKQWVDFESFPTFLPAVREVTRTSDVYSRWTLSLGRLSRHFVAEIVEQLPEERLAWRTIEGDVWFSGAAVFEAVDKEHTRVSLTVDWQPTTAVERAADTLGMADRTVRAALRAFKDFIESTGGPSARSRIKLVSSDG